MAQKKEDVGIRISKIRDVFCGGKNHEFARLVGISEQNASGYCNGKTPVGDKVFDRILLAFPRVSEVWLKLGKGDMLIDASGDSNEVMQNNVFGNNDLQLHKQAPSSDPEVYNKFLSIIEKKDAQIDRLLEMLTIKMNDSSFINNDSSFINLDTEEKY